MYFAYILEGKSVCIHVIREIRVLSFLMALLFCAWWLHGIAELLKI